MALEFNMVTNQLATCGSLTIDDTSTYADSPNTREDFGIAIFINVDPGDGTFVNDPTLSNLDNNGDSDGLGSWDIVIPNLTQNYEIMSYWVSLWVSGSYSLGSLVYYEGAFYKKNATGTGTQEPSDASTEWDTLDESDYSVFAALPTGVEESIANYEAVVKCPDYSVSLLQCNGSYRLFINTITETTKQYSVDLLDGTSIIVDSEIDVQAGYVDFSIPDTGVYVLTVQEDTGSGFIDVAKIPIYEYCTLKTCFTYLIDNVLCNNFDPCCESCGSEEHEKLTRQRQTLNQIIALYGSLLAYINAQAIDYIGITTLEDDRLVYMTRINNILSKTSDIIQRCELCAGAWQETTTSDVISYKPCNC